MQLSLEKLREEVLKFEDKDGGIDIDAMWRTAQSKGHPLHKYFTWDVNKAAIEHWRHQARALVHRVNVKFREEKVSVSAAPFYVRDPATRAAGGRYANLHTIKQEHQALVVQRSYRQAQSYIQRHKSIVEGFGLGGEYQAVDKALTRLIEKVDAMVPGEGAAAA